LLSIPGALFAALRGKLGLRRSRGVHLERGGEIRIEGHQSITLDGEMFEAENERPIALRPTAPMPFLRLAASPKKGTVTVTVPFPRRFPYRARHSWRDPAAAGRSGSANHCPGHD